MSEALFGVPPCPQPLPPALKLPECSSALLCRHKWHPTDDICPDMSSPVKEGSDITAEHMIDETAALGESEIVKFYTGSTVLLTGGTGFLGKLVIEKLLRACPDIKKIYLLARPKKNKDSMKRLQEQFDDVLYDKLRKLHPDFIQKVGVVEGDIGRIGLGMSAEDRETICKEVDVILHGAATVRFDEPIKTAVEINVRGTREIFILARACTKLRAVVHTSTAYSQCNLKHIGEKFYESSIPGDTLINLVESLDEKMLENMKTGLLGDFPNTYAYTKAIAEDIVKKYSKGLPVAMIRPAIVIGTQKEPVAGWIDNVYGPTGVVVGAAIGLLHSLHCEPKVLADLVPGDMVVNATLAAAWHAARDPVGNHEDAPPVDQPPPVYNYVSSEQKPLTWERFMAYNELYGHQCPTPRAVWLYLFTLNPNKFIHMIYTFFMHWIPAYLIDGLAICIGKKPMLVKAYEKIHKFSEVISYFSTQQWKFDNQNTQKLFQQMVPADQVMFNFDIASLDWNDYFSTYIKGVRVYLLKDPLDTIPEGKKKLMMFRIGHYTISSILCLVLLRVLWAIFSYVLGF